MSVRAGGEMPPAYASIVWGIDRPVNVCAAVLVPAYYP